ncbi:MAG: ornithine carbamoyltransferase [Dehalococcoidia bacterium]|nr:ornithine carbamoyltransferase [Dehalococcoidia bacterium]
MKHKDLLSISDLSSIDIHLLLADAVELRADGWVDILTGKTLALVFEKPSLRTRMSFELAMRQLGGTCIYLSPAEVGLGKRESAKDIASVLSRYADVLAVRTFAQETLLELARYSDAPVINALSDFEHPCQALADLLTMSDHKETLKDIRLAYIGDGNNVARSLLLAGALMGMDIRLATPTTYTLDEETIELASEYAEDSGGAIMTTADPHLAISDADVVYTDTWVSMGQEEEYPQRLQVFSGFRITPALMAEAAPNAIFMHCLPAHRGEEVAPEVIDGPASVVLDQAENRLYVQKAVLAHMLGGAEVASQR